MGVVEVLERVINLTRDVGVLGSQVKDIMSEVDKLKTKVIMLEASGELNAEKAKNAALLGAQAMNGQFIQELYALKAEVEALRASRGLSNRAATETLQLTNGDDSSKQ